MKRLAIVAALLFPIFGQAREGLITAIQCTSDIQVGRGHQGLMRICEVEIAHRPGRHFTFTNINQEAIVFSVTGTYQKLGAFHIVHELDLSRAGTVSNMVLVDDISIVHGSAVVSTTAHGEIVHFSGLVGGIGVIEARHFQRLN